MYLAGISVSDMAQNWEKLIAIGALAIALGLLQDLVPKPLKEWLIFWRIKDRLPGHRAFSKGRVFSSVIDREEVVDLSERENLGAKYQDRLFYRLYDNFRDKGSVKHYSFRYLQWRELACLAIVAGAAGSVYVAIAQGFLSFPVLILTAISTIVYLGSVAAARKSSNLLIDYVLLNERLSKLKE